MEGYTSFEVPPVADDAENASFEGYHPEYFDYYKGYDSYEDWWTYATAEDVAADRINLYLPPVLLITGTCGNIISFIILTRLTSKILTTILYLAILAILDVVMIYTRCVNIWLRQLVGYDMTRKIVNQSHAACQVYSFLTNLIIHLDAWMLAAAVLECTLLIAKPMKAHHLCNFDRVRNILLFLILLLVCINAHFFWTYGLEPDYMDNTKFFCTFSTFGSHYSEYFRNIVWPVMDLLSSGIGPGFVILVSCIHVFRKRCKQRHNLNLAEGDQSPPGDILQNSYLLDAQATHRFIITCLALGIISLVFNLPQTTYLTFEFVLERANLYEHFNSLNFIAQKRLGQVICESMKDIFLSLKFVFYIASWPTFRQELTSLCHRKQTPDFPNAKHKTYMKHRQNVARAEIESCLQNSVS